MNIAAIPNNKPINMQYVFTWTLRLLLFVLFLIINRYWIAQFISAFNTGYDLRTCFRGALFEILAGRSPCNEPGFYSPSWVAFLAAPFALLPQPIVLKYKNPF